MCIAYRGLSGTGHHPVRIGRIAEEFLQGVSDSFEAIIRGNTLVEYVKKGHTKAEGMERFLSKLHVPKEEIFAIGDSENDLPMFAAADESYAVRNACEEVN